MAPLVGIENIERTLRSWFVLFWFPPTDIIASVYCTYCVQVLKALQEPPLSILATNL